MLDGQALVMGGQSGDAVKVIQQALEAFGFPLKDHHDDGVFGNETKQAVIDFQTSVPANDIDGIVGPETMRLLDDRALAEERKAVDDKEEDNLKKVRREIEERRRNAGDDKRPSRALCLLDMYEAYRNGVAVKDRYMTQETLNIYIKEDRGNRAGGNFVHPSKKEKSCFDYLDLHVGKQLKVLTNELISEAGGIMWGMSYVQELSQIPGKGALNVETLKFLKGYFARRKAATNDIYSGF